MVIHREERVISRNRRTRISLGGGRGVRKESLWGSNPAEEVVGWSLILLILETPISVALSVL